MKTKIFGILIMVVSLLFITSCEEDICGCEENNYGTVIIKNDSGESLWVDVISSSNTYNNEPLTSDVQKIITDKRLLLDGEETTYNMVGAGDIRICASYDKYEDWQYKYEYIDHCETFEFTWESGKKNKI